MTLLALLEPELAVDRRATHPLGHRHRRGRGRDPGRRLGGGDRTLEGARVAARSMTIWTTARPAAGLRRTCPVEVRAVPRGLRRRATRRRPARGAGPASWPPPWPPGCSPRARWSIVAETRIEGRPSPRWPRRLGRPYDAVRKERRPGRGGAAAFALSYDDRESGTMTERPSAMRAMSSASRCVAASAIQRSRAVRSPWASMARAPSSQSP